MAIHKKILEWQAAHPTITWIGWAIVWVASCPPTAGSPCADGSATVAQSQLQLAATVGSFSPAARLQLGAAATASDHACALGFR
jgi:hypothetical protein